MNKLSRLTLLTTILGSGIVILDGTVVNLALPKIGLGLHASFADLQWIVDGYLLSLSALILLGGSLGDIFGRKKVYLFGLAGFGVSSLICGLAPSASMLIMARVLQGVFGALLVPGALSIINTNFAKEDRAAAISSWSAWIAIFAPIGPLLGGYLLDVTSWRWIFLINIPFVAICLGLGLISIKETREPDRHVDIPGAVLAILALAGLTYGLIQGPANHWQFGSLLPLFASLALSIAFIYYERRTKDPMVPLDLFKSRNFSGSNLMTFFMYGALGGFLFAFLIYMQTRLGYSSIQAGASILPIPISLFFLSRRFGKLAGQYGPRIFMTVGPIMVGLATFLLFWANPASSFWLNIFPQLVLFGVGLSVLVAPLTITVMSSVSDNSSGIASGINNAVSRAAGLIVIAVLGIFGTSNVYKFSIILCGGLCLASGLASLWIIQNPALILTKK
ncbi:MAG TPA: MFS transporter [Patescibacteria group bacterium]|nr:MFS transporter [Patescibacteria group bacterium]